MADVEESDLLSRFQGVLTEDIVVQRMEHFEGKEDQRVCTNYRGITLLSLLGKVYIRVLGFSKDTEQYIKSL